MKNRKKYSGSLLISSIILSLLVQIFFIIIIFYFNFTLDILAMSFLNAFLIVLIFYPFLYYLVFKSLIRQIKESKKIEKEMNKLAFIVDNSKDIIFMFKSKNGEIFYFNESAKNILGSNKKNISEIVSQRSKEKFKSGILQTLSNQFWEGEIYLNDLSGNELMVSQSLILNRNNHFCIAAISKDIHNSKIFIEQIEKQLKELEILNEIMIGREIKMAEMKKEIKELKDKLK